MDYRRPTIGFILSLILTSLAASCGPRASLQGESFPDVLKWIRPGTDIVQVLSENPAECFSESAVGNSEIQLGRAAFRSPFLLGGQAARQGLTCQACHTQGQTNAHFFVVGLSEEPGTADVTNFHFSDDLGDEVFNPSLIPSLSDDVHGVDYDPQSAKLEDLVTRLITQEFNGEVPNPDVFSALTSYLRALDVKACPSAESDVPKLKGADLMNYNIDGVSNMFEVLKTADYPAVPKQFMIASLRHEIGNIYRHYPKAEALQADLRDLGQLLNAREGAVEDAQLLTAYEIWNGLGPKLKSQYKRSLFNPDFIPKWMASK